MPVLPATSHQPQALIDPDYVVHYAFEYAVPRTHETLCERVVNNGFGFWHSSQLRAVDDIVTCVMCLGARQSR